MPKWLFTRLPTLVKHPGVGLIPVLVNIGETPNLRGLKSLELLKLLILLLLLLYEHFNDHLIISYCETGMTPKTSGSRGTVQISDQTTIQGSTNLQSFPDFKLKFVDVAHSKFTLISYFSLV